MEQDEKIALRTKLSRIAEEVSDELVAEASHVVHDFVLQELQKHSVSFGAAHVYPTPSKWKEILTQKLVYDLKDILGYQIVDQPDMTPDAPMGDRKYDVIIVPCLGFDTNCNRLGRGHGWYDRFLASQPQGLKIGLAFEALRCGNIPHESHDEQLDMVVTERGIYTSHGK